MCGRDERNRDAVLKRVIVEDITRERGEGVEFFSMIFF